MGSLPSKITNEKQKEKCWVLFRKLFQFARHEPFYAHVAWTSIQTFCPTHRAETTAPFNKTSQFMISQREPNVAHRTNKNTCVVVAVFYMFLLPCRAAADVAAPHAASHCRCCG